MGVPVAHHRVMRPQPARVVELLGGDVDRHHRGCCDGPQRLHRQVAEAADADHDCHAAGCQKVLRALDGVIGGDPGVGQGRGQGRVEAAQRHQVADAVDDVVLRHAAVAADPAPPATLTSHTFSSPRQQALQRPQPQGPKTA